MAKGMRADEIRELADADIRARIAELEEERFRLRFRSGDAAAGGSAPAAGDPQGHRAPEDGAASERAPDVVQAQLTRGIRSRHMAESDDDQRRRPTAPERSARKTRVGIVVSDKMQKTVVVRDRASRAAPASTARW